MSRPLFVPITWPPEVDELLGQLSDRELARHLHLDPHTVAARRRLLNIPAWKQPKNVLIITCKICNKKTRVSGRRESQLRQTCPPDHPFTRAGRLSQCHKDLIRATLKIRGAQPQSARRLRKKLGGSSVVRLLDG